MGLLGKLTACRRKAIEGGNAVVLPDADQDTYRRQIQSEEPAEKAFARLHLPEAYVFCDGIRLSSGAGTKADSIRARQAVLYELGRLCGRHPRFDTCDNLHAMLEQGAECPDVLYDSTGEAPDDKWVVEKGSIRLGFSGQSVPYAICTGKPGDEMILDMESAAASIIRKKAAYVLERLGAGAYETELPTAIWEMSGRSMDRMLVYRLIMSDAPEGDGEERGRLVFYDRGLPEVAGYSRDLGELHRLDCHVSAWLDLVADAYGEDSRNDGDDICGEVPLYDEMIKGLHEKAGIAEKVGRRLAGEPWDAIWDAETAPPADILEEWRL